jgi:2-dehydro-3-deoxyphosphogluconate aldolase/(4S)-4-hydroxy-2-oxoglutarate aldolase
MTNTGMTRDQVRERILEVGIVPVIRAASSRDARLAVDAICAGGIPIAELTMTVPGAIGVISELAKTMGSALLLGAGTVLDAKTAEKCIAAGAQFIVSPSFSRTTVKAAHKAGKLVMAGALTPTEVVEAWRSGSDFVKIFPCGPVGGPKYIQALKGPFPQVSMIPTGGVNLQTAGDFIKAGADALGVGGELVSQASIKSGNLHEITNAARQYVEIVREARNRLQSVASGG